MSAEKRSSPQPAFISVPVQEPGFQTETRKCQSSAELFNVNLSSVRGDDFSPLCPHTAVIMDGGRVFHCVTERVAMATWS